MADGSLQSVDPVVWDASQEIALTLADASCAAELGQVITNTLDRMVGCDLGSILSAMPGQDWSIAGEISDNRVLGQNYWRYAGELSDPEVHQMAGRFSIASDLLPLRRREQLAVFREFMTPNGLRDVAVGNWVVDGRLWCVGLARTNPTLTDREIGRLNSILPLVRAALRAAPWLDRADNEGYPGFGVGGPWGLTPCQERAMSLVLRGLTNKEIASLLGCSPNTVRNTLAEVFKKVGVSRRSELAFAVRIATTDVDPRRARNELRCHRRFMTAIAGKRCPPLR